MSRLKALRVAHGISQEKLANLVKTSQPQIDRLEKAPGEKHYRKMTVNWAQRLAPHLGDCNPLYLLGLSDDVKKPPKNAENSSKKQNVNDLDTRRSYPRNAPPSREGKKVTEDDAYMAAIGRFAIELERLRAELREIKQTVGGPNPRKARGK